MKTLAVQPQLEIYQSIVEQFRAKRIDIPFSQTEARPLETDKEFLNKHRRRELGVVWAAPHPAPLE